MTAIANEYTKAKKPAEYLHDVLLQTLCAIQLKVKKAKKYSGIKNVKKELFEVENLVELSLAQTRRTILQIAPPVMAGNNLIRDIKDYLDSYKENLKIDYKFVFDVPDGFSTDSGNEILRIFLEILSNIQKHSGADLISVELLLKNRKDFVLSVRDNGKGFKPLKKKFKYGINTILSYTKKIGGKVQIKSAPGRGTLVKLEFPVKKRGAL